MFKLTIDTGNAAFEEHGAAGEIVRILSGVIRRVANGDDFGILYDVNGNKVGSFSLEVEGDDDAATD